MMISVLHPVELPSLDKLLAVPASSRMEWRPPESTSDIDRLNKLVAYYESVNLDQIQQIANYKQTQEASAKSILEYEKSKKQLQKTIKSLEGRMKFDKIAAEGLKKKFNLLEVDVRELSHSNEQMNLEIDKDKSMIAQLKEDLNNNRSDKLKFMHENANLKKQVASLTSSETDASADAVFARTDLLSKLQMLDNTMSHNESLQRTVAAQSAEVLTLTHEKHDLHEKLLAAKKQVVSLEVMTAEHNRTIDILQHEVSRLRKELSVSSHSVNVRSTALLSRSGATNPANRISTDITHCSYGTDTDGPYALSRRPQTQHGLSRERNLLSSSSGSINYDLSRSASRSMSRSQQRSQQRKSLNDSLLLNTTASTSHHNLPALSESERLSAHKEYSYVDLSAHLQKPTESSTSAVLVGGGSISTHGNSLDKTMRSSLMQDYNEVIVAAQVGPSLRANASNNTHPHAHSQVSDTSHAVPAAMCSPVSTPYRRPNTQQHQPSPLKPLTAQSSSARNQHSTDSATWFQQSLATTNNNSREHSAHMLESLSNIKKCYSSSPSTNHSRKGMNSVSKEQAGDAKTNNPFVLSTGGDNSMWSAEDSNPNSPARVSFQPSDPSKKVKKAKTSLSQDAPNAPIQPPPETNNKKSMFVGAGLGLKHNHALDAELSNLNKGSTQQILKKILGDRFD